MPLPPTKPIVSILIAARNEEHNILNLLRSVSRLTYPKNELEVLIGDDGSTDQTAAMVRSFIADKSYMKLHTILPPTTLLLGKTNVLVQLATLAAGEYFFFTDADIILPPTWVEVMLENFRGKVGVVVGSTATSPISLFARCQGIEWLSVLNFMEICGRFNVPTTGMGNNMAVSRLAYEAIGGYESIPFSIVEDYALYNAIIKKGFDFKHVYNEQVLTYTKPPDSYFGQRKRWVTGGIQSKSPLVILALIQSLTLPVVLLLLVINPTGSVWLLTASFTINSLIGFVALQRMKLTSWFVYLPFYALYIIVFWFLQLINYLLPGSINWKNRNY